MIHASHTKRAGTVRLRRNGSFLAPPGICAAVMPGSSGWSQKYGRTSYVKSPTVNPVALGWNRLVELQCGRGRQMRAGFSLDEWRAVG
jgi:hypothetical protein